MRRGRQRQCGFTLPALLAVIAVCSLAWSIAGPLWSAHVRRDQEKELLRVGAVYARAIESYRDALPGSIRSYPLELAELLLDPRIPSTRRHLRVLYPDPMELGRPWGLVRDEFERIVGVYSQDDRQPLQSGPIGLEGRVLPSATRYSDWKFVATSE